MEWIDGDLYDGLSSRARPARLLASAGGEVAVVVEGVERGRHGVRSLEISPRLGDTPRHIRLPDGGKFETADNAAVDRLLARHGVDRGSGLVHALESHYLIAGVALVLVLVLGVLFVTRGVPALSKTIAFNLPDEMVASLGRKTFEFFDDKLFDPTELPLERRKGLREGFEALTAQLDEPMRLRFRAGGDFIGANAFAMPDGTVVVTDELVALAEDDGEILSVMAHEAGHVMHRHGLRQVLHQSMINLFVIYVTGDPSNLAVMIPSMLVELGYSRDFEREADDFAYQFMLEHDLDPVHFADIMQRLAQDDMGGESAWWSTHPGTAERIERFRRDPG